MKRIVAGAAAALVLALASGGASGVAYADEGESIEQYRIDYDIKADGVVHVKEDFRYNFSGSEHHGPERLISTREQADKDNDRVYTISNATASSQTSAPDDVDVSALGDETRIRIGDPGVTVSGQQQYTLEYDIKGGLNSVDGHGELFWDAAGPDWDVPIEGLTVTVRAPGAGISKQRCLFGEPGSKDPCDDGTLSGSEATFEQARVDPGEVLTVVAAFSLDDVTVPAPVLIDRVTTADYFALTPLTGGVSAGLLVVGLVPFVLSLRGRRDLRYAGVTPGLLPATGVAAATEPAPSERSEDAAVQFAPPAGISPGEAGVLLRRKTTTVETTATLIDLAVRGYLHIDGSRGDWTLTALHPPDNHLRPHELALLNGLFAGGTTTSLGSSSRKLAGAVKQVNTALGREAKDRGWYRKLSGGASIPIPLIIFLCFFFFIFSMPFFAIMSGLGAAFRAGLVVVALVLAILLIVVSLFLRRRKGRLPEGYAAYYQVLGFKRYLETAEADQLRFEEGENIFSRYLPWAIAFGLTHRWAQVCERLAQQSRIPPDVDWYHGSNAWSYAGFSSSYASLHGTVNTAHSAASSWSSSSSGGGSGFSSSSSSGGGGGGGGGGSW
ncbi:DUF2207 domain-containing protein [Flindersiella endophytica]